MPDGTTFAEDANRFMDDERGVRLNLNVGAKIQNALGGERGQAEQRQHEQDQGQTSVAHGILLGRLPCILAD